MTTRQAISTVAAPPPAGPYSQAISAEGRFVFLAGQTPRTRDGRRISDALFVEQARLALDNLEAAARASGLSLRHAVKINVYLRSLEDIPAFNQVFAEYIGDPPPARTLTQSSFIDFAVEIDAILLA
ncbi:RidA family protein [Bradyrhizobium neotropicale]|uniref:RidA family protein n=1 Tax=Bradyrhizobium neotropicale TaxID=1497615 RepID=UPI001AD6AD54|nr:RidA family protein [Bradyrhizobium neotropicale]MBO4223911.1 RidA family protein [Bradyrhizobium neotropicale]